jgi:branched-chain amino acid transport system permease protein
MPFFVRTYTVEVAILFFTYIILAQSYRLVNTTGDWSLCHFVLFGVGAYGSGLLSKNFDIPIWVTIPIGGAIASVVALAIWQPLVRTKGFGFFIASFALGELVRLIWVKVHNPFGGPRGIIDIPYPPMVGPVDFSQPIPYYFMAMGTMLGMLYVMYQIDRARLGDSWKAIHSDPGLTASMGINVQNYRVMAGMTGAFFAGIAGGLLVHRLGAVDPRVFDIISMVYLVIWVVVGGTTTFWGPILGVAVMQTVFEVTRPLLEIRPAIFGSILILFLIFLPNGLDDAIIRMRERFSKRTRERTSSNDLSP